MFIMYLYFYNFYICNVQHNWACVMKKRNRNTIIIIIIIVSIIIIIIIIIIIVTDWKYWMNHPVISK